ncbi:MAG: hypothetical protein HKO65_20030 [Gemmatimonadetes bacterium]|nr:hypothetical protein [Gemmatimonadota bacterium]NNM07394.1 hypothetical protein [Gemmatimonadota bacterium]
MGSSFSGTGGNTWNVGGYRSGGAQARLGVGRWTAALDGGAGRRHWTAALDGGTGTLRPVWPSNDLSESGKIGPRRGFSSLKNHSFAIAATLLILAAAPIPCSGQLILVGGLVQTKDLDGQWGADVRFGFDPPGIPVGIFMGADYFLTRCTTNCSLRGFRAGAILHSSAPVIQPYLSGAYVVRERELAETSERLVGPAVGAGLRVTTGIKIQVEAVWEFFGGGANQWVFRVGLGL